MSIQSVKILVLLRYVIEPSKQKDTEARRLSVNSKHIATMKVYLQPSSFRQCQLSGLPVVTLLFQCFGCPGQTQNFSFQVVKPALAIIGSFLRGCTPFRVYQRWSRLFIQYLLSSPLKPNWVVLISDSRPSPYLDGGMRRRRFSRTFNIDFSVKATF